MIRRDSDWHSLDASALISLDSGQAFRWKKGLDGLWRGIISDCLWVLSADVMGTIETSSPLYAFFNMNLDWEDIRGKLLGTDPYLDAALEEFKGLRILKQNHFETLLSFIVSSCNNIRRIAGIIERFCSFFGRPVQRSVPEGLDVSGLHSFPSLSELNGVTVSDLECCRMGFRSQYIVDAVEKVNSGEVDLDGIERMPFDRAKKELMKIKGVGDKVASCVLLFSYSFFEAFPKDVWIKRVLDNCVGGKTERDFGEYAGVAQQYMFMKARQEKF